MDYFVQLRVITRAFIRGRQDHREERLDVRIRGEVGMISLGDKGLHKPEHGQPFPLEKARKNGFSPRTSRKNEVFSSVQPLSHV